MTQLPSLNVPDIIDRMKAASNIRTDAELAAHLSVSSKTVSSWRSRNSLPIESVLQISEETNKNIEYFLLGDQEKRPEAQLSELFDFGDLRIRDFELAGESILAGILEQFAGEGLAFMDEREIKKRGEDLGLSIAHSLALVRQERRALLDSGKLDDVSFEEYVRKAFRFDLPHYVRATKNKMTKREQGPQ